ncbi:MAG: RNA-binding protein [Candidatus Micrarchaeota archaeon]|nr:RNA-binding protein [Candidatus Micrarchaeota archaeon]
MESKLLVKDKQIVIPGEDLAVGYDFLPGRGTFRTGESIRSKVLGQVRLKEKLVNVISLSGVYIPKPGDGVIGVVDDVQTTFWVININSPYKGILLLSEAVKEFVEVSKTDIARYFDIGELIYTKVINVTKSKIVTLSMMDPRAKKLRGGRIVTIIPSRVPRLIGKKGSMIEMIKEKTGCQIVVGQNGVVWLKGEREDLATKAILEVEKESYTSGLTERIARLLEEG